MKTPRYGIVLLLTNEGGLALAGSPFRIGIPQQASILSPLSEVHAPGDPCRDLLGPTDAQRLSQHDMGKDEGSLGVPTPLDYPLPFRRQDFREAAPHRSRGPGVPAR